MERYDYFAAVKNDILGYINDNENSGNHGKPERSGTRTQRYTVYM